MKILIGGSSSKYFHLNAFSEYLKNKHVETLLVQDVNYVNGFPSRNYLQWLFPKNNIKNLIQNFKPDLIFVDRPRHFALESVKQRIPTLIHLRGDFWSEIKWAKETKYKKNCALQSHTTGYAQLDMQKWFRINAQAIRKKLCPAISLCFTEST